MGLIFEKLYFVVDGFNNLGAVNRKCKNNKEGSQWKEPLRESGGRESWITTPTSREIGL